MSPPDDPLDPLLERWRSAPPPVPSVAAEVRRRLADAPAPGFLERLAADLARPAFAITFIAACALLGLFLAEVRISRMQAERNRQLAESYVRLIDPLYSSRSGAPRT
ncbi:MAG TPA: hypothetical protein VHC86_07205 [Opitutaceae bacterium]|nr:hypothetical protein [Opitutaceae bacterium]